MSYYKWQHNNEEICGNCGYRVEAHTQIGFTAHSPLECPKKPDATDAEAFRIRHDRNMAIVEGKIAAYKQAEFDEKAKMVCWIIIGILVFITICASSRGDVADDILAARAKEKAYNAKNNVVNYATPEAKKDAKIIGVKDTRAERNARADAQMKAEEKQAYKEKKAEQAERRQSERRMLNEINGH